jgi:tetratricopeptide (TPR) repeat protein
MFKRFCVIILSILSIYALAADTDFKVRISSKRPLVGEVVTLSLTARAKPELTSLPKIENAEWLPSYNRMSTSIINGKAEYSQIYAFRITGKGIIKIPELEVSVGGKIRNINSFEIQAVSAGDKKLEDNDGESVAIKDIIFGKCEILNLSKEFYVGEEISLEISLLNLRRFNVRPTSYPEIKLNKIVFRDYSQQNRENPHFLLKRKSSVSINGKEFIKQPFETAFRTISAGIFMTNIKIQSEISVPTEQRNFFGRSVYKSRPYIVDIPFEIKIKPLPKAPEKFSFLGLVGNWDVNFTFRDKEIKVGDPITLAMTVYGLGTLETLNIPKLEVDGFRVYPPEIDKKTSYDGREKAEIKYVLIPLVKGNKELKMNVSIFSSLLNKYKTFTFSKKIKIKKSDNPSENINYTKINPASSIPDSKFNGKQIIPRADILFLKTAADGDVKVPLYLNWLWAYIILGILGPLCWFISEVYYWRQQKLGNNKALQRRRDALKRKGKMLKAINRSSDDDLNTVIQNEAVPFINDILDMPPGTTTSELAGKVKNDSLAQCLTSVGEASYLPGSSNFNKKELREKLYKALKRLTLIAVLFMMPQMLDAAEEIATPLKGDPVNFAQAVTAYDSGDFCSAAEFFRSNIVKDSPDPALLYNLGTCLCNQGDLAGALVCFERAHLLAPYDTAITENLNFVRRKLFLPEVNKIDGPTEMLLVANHSLRPDEWLLVAMFAWALGGIFLAFRRKLSFNKRIVFISSCTIIFILALGACIYEKMDAYSNKNAIITSPEAELRSLPSMRSGSKLVRLRMGTVVRVIESRFDWVRIKSDNTKGWIKKDKMTRIAPGNDLPPVKETKKIIKLK